MKTNIKRTAAAVAVATVAGLGLAVPASAAASSGRSSASTTYCYTIIAKIAPPAPAARVVAHGCAGSAAAADVARQKAAPDAEAPLVTFYADEGYQGSSDTIYGKNGACDASGYGIADLTYENDWVIGGISAYKTHSNCWGQKYWKTTEGWSPWTTPCKTFTNTWEVPYVGANCNDQVYSFWVWDNKA